MFKLKFSTQPVRQGSHQLKAQPSIRGWIEILRESDAVVGHFHRKGAVVSGLATETFTGSPVGWAYLLALVRSSAVTSPA